jgi:glycosyltransferase involved in cell wall biosynthesis
VRIAIVHSFYSSDVPSGENQVVIAQKQALEASGHEVKLIAWYTDEEAKFRGFPLRAAWWTVSGNGGDPTGELVKFSPDVVHVHNLFPNIGTKWLRAGVWPIVSSLHNYRPVCANGLLYRDGKNCTECVDQSWTSGIKHACYRESRLATVPLAIRNKGGVQENVLLSLADLVTVPSARAFENYLGFGVPEEKLSLLPYFVDDVYSPVMSAPSFKPRWLIASRLSPEKGVAELVQRWPKEHSLEIAGAGPEEQRIGDALSESTCLLGFKSPDWLASFMPEFTGLVFPGRSPEGIPTTALQALGAGLPIVARAGNGAADLVQAQGVGRVYEDDRQGASLLAALNEVSDSGKNLRIQARELYERDFSRSTWIHKIDEIYENAMSRWSAHGQ